MKSVLVLWIFLMAVSAAVADGGKKYVPGDAERARWTMQDMMSWKIALEAYKTDHNGYPDAKDAEGVSAAVEPMYIAHLPRVDAWGHPYRFERVEQGYRLVSAGADGKFDSTTWSTGGKQTSFDADAVVIDSSRWWFRSWQQ